MKKLMSMVLALAMILSLSVPAMAVTNSGDTTDSLSDTTSIPVGAQYVGAEAGEIATVYYVKIAWTAGENTLTYTNKATSYRWNAETMKYEVANADDVQSNGWAGAANYTISATNQSNAAVNAKIAVASVTGITAEAAYTNGTESVWNDTDNLLALGNAAEGVAIEADASGTAKEGSVNVAVSVTDGEIEAAGNVATISITLSAAE